MPTFKFGDEDDWLLEHTPTGATFEFDGEEYAWVSTDSDRDTDSDIDIDTGIDTPIGSDGLNLENITYRFWGDRPGFHSQGMSIFQMGDDSADVGESGYATGAHFVTESGERIATLAADKSHNHIGVYTRGKPFDGSDSQPVKRFNIGGGDPISKIDYYRVDEFRVGPRTEDNSHDGNMDFVIESESTGDINLRYDNNGRTVANYMYDESRGSVRLQNYNADTADFLEFRGDGDIRAHGHDFTGVGSIDLEPQSSPDIPSSGWRIFTDDSDGGLKAVDSDGNVSTIADG